MLIMIGLVMVVFQLLTVGMTVVYMRRKFRWLEQVKRKHASVHAMLLYLESSLAHMNALEMVHLLNMQPTLTSEIEHVLHALWQEVERTLARCLASTAGDGSKFSILSVQGGFDLYREIQDRFLTHSNAGDKAFAEHFFNTSRQEMGSRLKQLLESTKALGDRSSLAELESDDSLEYSWVLYPTVGLIFSIAAFLGVYVVYA